MLIDVQVNYYRTNRIISVDASTLRVEVVRLQSDPSTLYYKLVGTTDQGRLLIRTSENAQEILDLYDGSGRGKAQSSLWRSALFRGYSGR